MTELQEARAKWIAALERENALEREVQRLKASVYDLQQALLRSEMRRAVDALTAPWLALTLPLKRE